MEALSTAACRASPQKLVESTTSTKDLWSLYARGGFYRRNLALAKALDSVAVDVPIRRVLELASDGSFMTAIAVRQPALSSRLRRWVTTDISRTALRHSTRLFACGPPCVHYPLKRMTVPRNWTETQGTYRVSLDRRTIVVEVAPMDASNLSNCRLDAFDAVVTISMEHFLHDLRLLEAIPRGTVVAFSVPNFGAPRNRASLAGFCERSMTPGQYLHECDQHWHTFESENEIVERYGGLLSLRAMTRVQHIGKWAKWVVVGRRL